MSKYIFLYNGPATPMEEMTPEMGQEVMAKWGVWIEKVGTALIDIGAPFGTGTSITDAGSETKNTQLNGYSIVEAANMDAAKGLADSHPFLSDSEGKFAIEIFELMDVPM